MRPDLDRLLIKMLSFGNRRYMNSDIPEFPSPSVILSGIFSSVQSRLTELWCNAKGYCLWGSGRMSQLTLSAKLTYRFYKHNKQTVIAIISYKTGCVHFDNSKIQSVCFVMPKRQFVYTKTCFLRTFEKICTQESD